MSPVNAPTNPRRPPLLAITMGDINGVGPEILAKALAREAVREVCQPVIFGSASVYNELRANYGAPRAVAIDTIGQAHTMMDAIPFLECDVIVPPYRPGMLDPRAGDCAMKWLEAAVSHVMDGHADALVTCPINKEGIHRAGYSVMGHTDYIAERTGSAEYRMCLFAGTMRIVHITGHLSLRDALNHVRKDRIADSIRITHEALSRMGLYTPRIAVAGLNPHAGEAGALGREEIDEILPAIRECSAQGIECSGPHSPDAVFARMRQGEFDAVVAMYHDQGHIPLKLIAMDDGVNVTLGIPIVRTSVDHGTAYDIAGSGRARENSLCAAIELAASMAANQPGGHG